MILDAEMNVRIDRSRIHFQRFEDETVLINVESGFYYSVSRSGSELLELMENGCPVGSLVAALLGDSEEAVRHSSEIHRFIKELIEEGILSSGGPTVVPGFSMGISRPVRASIEGFEPPVLQRFDDVRDLLLIDPVHMVDQREGWPKT